MKNTHIVVVGGGYAGVLAASRLWGRLRGQTTVTLVSERDELVNRIRLHEALAGRKTDRLLVPLASIVPRDVVRVCGRVKEIDAAGRRIKLDDGSTMDADAMVVALGSRPTSAIPGAQPWLSSPEMAREGAVRLRALPAGSDVVVAGDGLTALECATEIAEAHPRLRVSLVGPSVGRDLSPAGVAVVRAALDALGVQCVPGRVLEVQPDAVVLQDGTRVPAAFTVIAAGAEGGGAGIASDLPQHSDGRFVVDETLHAAGVPQVMVAGDAARAPAHLPHLRMACATAMPMAAHAADEVAGWLTGRAARSFRFRFAMRCISLGRRRALIQRTDGSDHALDQVWSGTPAVLVKEAICRFVIGALRIERQLPGAYHWPQSALAAPLAALAVPGAQRD